MVINRHKFIESDKPTVKGVYWASIIGIDWDKISVDYDERLWFPDLRTPGVSIGLRVRVTLDRPEDEDQHDFIILCSIDPLYYVIQDISMYGLMFHECGLRAAGLGLTTADFKLIELELLMPFKG